MWDKYAQQWKVPVVWKPTSRITSRANPSRPFEADGPTWSMEAGGSFEGTVDLATDIGFQCSGAPGWTIASTAVFNRAAGNAIPGVAEFIIYPDSPLSLPANMRIPYLSVYGYTGPINLPAGGKLTVENFEMYGDVQLNLGTFVLGNANMSTYGTSGHVVLNAATLIVEGDSWANVRIDSVVAAAQSWLFNRGTFRWTVRGSGTPDSLLLINYGTAYLGLGSGNGFVSNGTVYTGYDYDHFDPSAIGSGAIYSPYLASILTPTSVVKMRVFDPENSDDGWDHFNGGGDFMYLDGELTVEFIPNVDWAPPAVNMTFDLVEWSNPTQCAGTFKTVTPINFPTGLGVRLEYIRRLADQDRAYNTFKIAVTICSTSDSTCNVVPTTNPFSAVFPTGLASKIPAGMWTKPADIPSGAPTPRTYAPSTSNGGAPGTSNGGAPGTSNGGAPVSSSTPPGTAAAPTRATAASAAGVQLPFLLILGLLALSSYLLL